VSEARVQVLYFAGCPNYERAHELVENTALELGLHPRIELVEVKDSARAQALRFLGSPTVRVDGHDVEPGADERRDFSFSCRVYRTPQGVREVPELSWINRALETAARPDRTR
jgi:hypothetical protein